MDCSLPSSSVHGDSPGKNTGVGGHSYDLDTVVGKLAVVVIDNDYYIQMLDF